MSVLKKITFILILSSYIGTKLYAQSAYNLVPNYSFEDNYGCPIINLNGVKDWYFGGGSPDLFSNCSFFSQYNVPINQFGTEQARTGNNYAGFGVYGVHFTGTPNDIREYVQTQLKDSLLKDQCYKVIFYVSLADSLTQYCNNIGAYFSRDSFTYGNYNVLPFIPQVSNNTTANPLKSCTGWVKVEGTFIAQGGESHITIGNFNDDASSSVSPANCFNGSISGSYYYLDDVWVIPCDTTAIIATIEKEPTIPNVFTPNGDNINDVWEFKLPTNCTLSGVEVYNRWGISLTPALSEGEGAVPSPRVLRWDGRTTSGIECSSGIYFYVLEYKDAKGDKQKKNGYISLIR